MHPTLQYQITLAVYRNAKTPWININEWLPADINFAEKDTTKDNGSFPTIEYYFNDDKFNEWLINGRPNPTVISICFNDKTNVALARNQWLNTLSALYRNAFEAGFALRRNNLTTDSNYFLFDLGINLLENKKENTGKSDVLEIVFTPITTKSKLLRTLASEKKLYDDYKIPYPSKTQNLKNYNNTYFETFDGYSKLALLLTKNGSPT